MSDPENGRKYDGDKPRCDLLLDFRNALLAVADVTTFGAQKYRPHDWLNVPDGYTRYKAALVRHLLHEGPDDESGLDHLAHLAWNALAVLELHIRSRDINA